MSNKVHDYPFDKLIKIIAKSDSNKTGLTIDQLKEAINLYTLTIRDLLTSKTCPEDIKFTIPNIGKIKLNQKKGLKAGSTYKISENFGMTSEGRRAETITVTVEEDQPDYQRAFVDVFPTLQREIREVSEKRNKNGK